MIDRHQNAPRERISYQNRVLTIIAVLLAVIVTQRADVFPQAVEAEAASAQRAAPTPPNAAAQRVKIIQELEKLDRRLDSIEKKLGAPIDVNVISMPEVKVAE